MRRSCFRPLITFILLGWSPLAGATLSCTAPVSTGFSTAYAAAGVVPNVSQGTVSFNCTRSAAGDATSILLTANNGAHASGVQNRAQNGSRILYEAYKDSACASVWTSQVASDYWLLNLLNILGAQSISVSYWGCITVAGQVVAARTYTDTVTMQVLDTTPRMRALSGKSTFPVSIISPATLAITTAPGNVAFTYTAFGPAVNASTTFVITGTLDLPYTMALDADNGVVSGLNYGLTIDSQASPVSARGSGSAQTHTVSGTMPAGQAGTCATGTCSSSQVRTLTITY